MTEEERTRPGFPSELQEPSFFAKVRLKAFSSHFSLLIAQGLKCLSQSPLQTERLTGHLPDLGAI
jgi:hypothetical protein